MGESPGTCDHDRAASALAWPGRFSLYIIICLLYFTVRNWLPDSNRTFREPLSPQSFSFLIGNSLDSSL